MKQYYKDFLKFLVLTFLVYGFVIVFIISSSACAHTTLDAKLGGMLHQNDITTNKLISLGFTGDLTRVFKYRFEGGLFALNDAGPNTRTWFTGVSLGTGVTGDWYYARVFTGPALVSRTDDHLNTPLEFNTDIEVGLRDKTGVELGLGYKHMSNGGITNPNLGQDFMYLGVKLPLGGSR